MIDISDTSPLTYLHQIDRFTLLGSLYDEVVIPPAVERVLKDVGAPNRSSLANVIRG